MRLQGTTHISGIGRNIKQTRELKYENFSTRAHENRCGRWGNDLNAIVPARANDGSADRSDGDG